MNDTTSQEYLEISFSGNNIRPDVVKAGDIADIIKAVESLVEAQVQKDLPGLKGDQVIVGFTNIRATSIDLEFRSPYKESARSAFKNAGKAINENDYTGLPSNTFNALVTISTFTRKQKCTATLSHQNGQKRVLATITPDTKIERLHVLKGETTIYAKVVRTGGKEPKVEIETIDGRTLFCDAPVDITIVLGSKLYQTVGLIGIAEWDYELNNVTQFSIKDVIEYEHKPFKDALNELADATRKYYSGISDVEKHISTIRGTD